MCECHSLVKVKQPMVRTIFINSTPTNSVNTEKPFRASKSLWPEERALNLLLYDCRVLIEYNGKEPYACRVVAIHSEDCKCVLCEEARNME